MECTIAVGPTYENAESQNARIEMLSKQVLIKMFVWLKFIWSVFSFLLLCTIFFFFKPCFFLHLLKYKYTIS